MNTTALTTRPQAGVTPWHRNAGDIAIVRNKCKDATPQEFEEFVAYCRLKGLDPIDNQAIMIVYGRGEKRKATIITTQAGMRVMAERAGGYHPARPNDTQWTYTKYQIERQKWLDEANAIRLLKDRQPVLNDIQENMPPDPANPAGLLECRTVIYKHDKPVEGIAQWSAYAPLTPHPDCFDLKETGDFWNDKKGNPTSRKKMRRVVKAGINLSDHLILDLSGRWGADSTGMLAKCANVHALKAAFPDHFGHGFYTEETTDKMVADHLTATELLEMAETERRQNAVGQRGDEYVWSDGQGHDGHHAAGEFGDVVLRSVRACKYREDYDTLMDQRLNKESFNRYWANHKADALDVKAEFEAIAERLPQKPAPVTIEHEAQDGVPQHA